MVHQKLLVWEIPLTVAKPSTIKGKKWDSSSPCSPLTCGLAQAWTPRKGNSWCLLKQPSCITPAHDAADPRLSSRSLAAPQPDYKFLKGRELILYIFPVSIWSRRGGGGRLLGWQPSQKLKNVIRPHPQPASSLLITRGRHSGIAFKMCLPPSCLRSYVSSSCSPEVEGETKVHWCIHWDIPATKG